LAHFRNRIAHSPIVYGWNGPDGVGPPNFLTVVDFKEGIGGSGGNSAIELSETNAKVDGVAAVAQALENLYRTIWHSAGNT
jgi:hypothetical protein